MYVEAYYGFGSKKSVYLKGRLLKDPVIIPSKISSRWRPFISNLKKFLSREGKRVPLKITLGINEYQLITDHEGYYDLSIHKITSRDYVNGKGEAKVWYNDEHIGTHKIFFPPESSNKVIVSDVDDTILITNVSSSLKMLYLSIFKSPWQRQSVEQAAQWMKYISAQGKNLVVYLSHSPWNLYANIASFLKISSFPIGPIFLRDFGFYLRKKPEDYINHKKIYLKRLIEFYEDKAFILIGDSAEKDPIIYSEVDQEYPGRVERIYIRKVKSLKINPDLTRLSDKIVWLDKFPVI